MNGNEGMCVRYRRVSDHVHPLLRERPAVIGRHAAEAENVGGSFTAPLPHILLHCRHLGISASISQGTAWHPITLLA